MVVVDTNILAPLLIEGDLTREAQAVYAQDSDWRSEAFVLIEFSNVLATQVRTQRLAARAAALLLADAERVLTGLVQVPHARALELAIAHGVSAYDARFLAAAHAFSSRLVTDDSRLRSAAPSLTRSLAQALEA
jgi:predicted nucleic acid-binding protein